MHVSSTCSFSHWIVPEVERSLFFFSNGPHFRSAYMVEHVNTSWAMRAMRAYVYGGISQIPKSIRTSFSTIPSETCVPIAHVFTFLCLYDYISVTILIASMLTTISGWIADIKNMIRVSKLLRERLKPEVVLTNLPMRHRLHALIPTRSATDD